MTENIFSKIIINRFYNKKIMVHKLLYASFIKNNNII